MKKTLFAGLLLFALMLVKQNSFAQTASTSGIMSLLSSELGLTQQQTPVVQTLVTEYASKFASSNKKASSGGSLVTKAENSVKSGLAKDFSSSLGTVLTPAQNTKYQGIESKVTGLFNQLK